MILLKHSINTGLRSLRGLSHGASNAGDLQSVDYADSTSDIAYTYDRRGRQQTAACNSVTTTFTYSPREIRCTDHGCSHNWWLH